MLYSAEQHYLNHLFLVGAKFSVQRAIRVALTSDANLRALIYLVLDFWFYWEYKKNWAVYPVCYKDLYNGKRNITNYNNNKKTKLNLWYYVLINEITNWVIFKC